MALTQMRYILRSLFYYRRMHLGLFFGAALCTAVVTGALVIGDSVRFSLHRLAEERLGRTAYVINTGERFFRAELADDLRRKNLPCAALLRVRGSAVNPAAARRANEVQVIGVDNAFAEFFPETAAAALQQGEIAVNGRLAERLGLQDGEVLLLRLEKPQSLPRDAPFAALENLQTAGRFRIRAVLSPAHGGRFNLRNHQVEPFTVFMNLDALAELVELNSRANLLLSAGTGADELQNAIAGSFQIEDASLYLVPIDSQIVELRSQRVFLESNVLEAVARLALPHQAVFTYLVNEIRLGERITPYSFISALDPAPFDLREDEILLNQWAAHDLSAHIGDSLTLSYYVLGSGRKLIERKSGFRLKAVVPLTGRFTDSKLMPDLPGLTGRENCRDWDAGFPIDLEKIRDKDEEYWDTYRGTPKAFVSLTAARQMWSNRFGDLTAVRFSGIEADSLRRALAAALSPNHAGLIPQPVRSNDTADPSVSFARLFIGLSFFLIIAALLLTALLFSFEAQQRLPEHGLLLSLGFPLRRVRRLLLAEAAVVALAGALFGVLPGLAYHQIILTALKTVWRDVISGADIHLYVQLSTLTLAFAVGFLISIGGLFIVLRRTADFSPADLYRGIVRLPLLQISGRKSVRFVLFAGLFGATAALWYGKDKPQDFLSFFAAGVFLLVALLAATDEAVRFFVRRPVRPSLAAAGRRNIVLDRRRSLTVVGITAAGVFLTTAVGSHRLPPPKNPQDPSSGTGGFAYWSQSSLPILFDLNDLDEREKRGITADFVVLPLRLQEGDDASCLNLHRVSQPPLLGVDAARLHERRAFSFAQITPDVSPAAPWLALEAPADTTVVPAVADQTVIVWGLGKQIGDTLSYVDEFGRPFTVRLVAGLQNSIFQGNLLISEQVFLYRFPSTSGYRVLLIDAPEDGKGETERQLTWALEDYGFEAVSASQRLAAFNAVSNTYLSIFMILGALGLLIGALGLGVLVYRRAAERRGELALLRALGFDRSAIRTMLFAEHLVLLLVGVVCGVSAALAAVVPGISASGSSLPLETWVTLILVPVFGAAVLYRTADSALRQNILPALRNE